MDPTAILVGNLQDALRQVSQYVSLGLVSAISAFVLDRTPTAPSPSPWVRAENMETFGGFVKMPRYAAKFVLLGVYFVAGIMAYIAAESALSILSQLSVPIRTAVCTQASIVTAAVGYRVIAAVLPIVFVLPILWRTGTRLRAISLKEDSGVTITLLGFFMLPYAALGLLLLRVRCGG